MAVVSMVVGATTSDGATFVAKVDGSGPVRVAVADNSGMTDPVFTASQAVDGQGVATVVIASLDPNSGYWWQVEDNAVLDASSTGQFRTHPSVGTAASYTLAVAGDAGLTAVFPGSGSELVPDRISNHPIFDTIRQKALAGQWLAFLHLGDLHYYDLGSGNHGVSGGGSLANYRRGYDDILLQSNQAALYRDVSWHYQWDDHDYGPNNSDGTLADKANALQVYGERVPHHALDGSNGIYQSWTIGRVLFVALDCRFNRDPNSDPQSASKTMLGSAQKAWLDDLLANSSAQALVVLSSSPWTGAAQDTWAGFTDERDELAALFIAHGWADRMVMCYADRHALGIDSGATNPHGGFPLMQAASLDASPSSSSAEGRFDVVPDTPGRAQWGTITVQDLGTALSITLTGWSGSSEVGSYTLGVVLPSAPVSANLLRALTGSHTATFDARILTTFQAGEDPDGTAVTVIDGQVDLDGTAEVRGSADVTIGEQNWPSRPDDVLAPWGNELFLRRGVDLGGNGIVWVPLGYYRIVNPGQSMAPSGPIQLACFDRMWAIRRSKLLQPRQYPTGTTLGAIVDDLVREIYPQVQIVWDDNLNQTTLLRPLVVERERYGTLHEVATAVGKVVHWDRVGRLRLQAPPDPGTPVWRVNHGPDGVMIDPSRNLSTETAFNAVVVEGEGGDTSDPVRGVAVDTGANSPTRFGGRFGSIPEFVNSPLVTTTTQARTAAANYLRRNLGAPYELQFTAVPNPTLDPHDPIRVDYADGSTELHVMRTVTIPLSVEAPLSGTTQEQRLITVTTT